MLSDALKAAAYEAEELEKKQKEQESRLIIYEARICELEDETLKLKSTLKKVKDSLYSAVIALNELKN